MKKLKPIFKLCALMLSLLAMLSVFVSCAQDKTVIGTVNGNAVYYDELYFLVSNYKASVAEKCNNDKALMQAELDRIVKENITANYAILELCEQNGLKYADIEDEIDDRLEMFIAENFNGSESDYNRSRKEIGMSERYDRYLLGLEILSEQLPSVYVKKDGVLTKEADIIQYIKKNFIHVNHLVIFNDEGDDPAQNLAKITQAKQLLDNGERINSLIGRGFSEDFSDPDASGYYITKGTMLKAYEDAAFSLDVGEHSDVISAYGENNYGEMVSCYYVIQRLDMSEEHIDSNFASLKNDYYNSLINSDLEKISETLEFIPNEKYNKLDLTDLSKSQNPAIAITISCAVTIIVAAVVILIIVKQKLKKKNVSYKNSSIRRKA